MSVEEMMQLMRWVVFVAATMQFAGMLAFPPKSLLVVAFYAVATAFFVWIGARIVEEQGQHRN